MTHYLSCTAPDYVLYDHGVIINSNSAIPYFNIAVRLTLCDILMLLLRHILGQ